MKSIARKEKQIKGIAVSSGIAVAKVCLVNEGRHSNISEFKISPDSIEQEKQRFRAACVIAKEKILETASRVRRELGDAEGGIFDAYFMILDDPQLHKEIEELVETKKINIESAIVSVLDQYELRMLAIDDEYIRGRASDFGEIKRRLLDALGEKGELRCLDGVCKRGHNRIIVAEELTPQITVDFESSNILGFVTERGGTNSHGAILARALGIPAVSGLKNVRDIITCGTEILVNGDTGEVIMWPTDETVAELHSRQSGQIKMPAPVAPVPEMKVLGNISMAAEAESAAEMQAEGIGLYRTEMELIACGGDLDENRFYKCYLEAFEAINGGPMTFRMFDLGSDKVFNGLTIPNEHNPALGLRGTRLLLKNKELLRMQARALARLSVHGPISVMYPMIVDKEQFITVKKMFEESIADIKYGKISHGAMFEIPSACIQADEIMEVADFGSIGSNDLVQYMFAADRSNELLFDEDMLEHPVLWQTMRMVVDAGRKHGKVIAVCGELASEPQCLKRLLEIGINTISVNIRSIPVVRQMLKE